MFIGVEIGLLGVCQVSRLRLLNMKYELKTVIVDKFLVNCLSLMSFLQNLCSFASVSLFSLEIYPVFDPISKGLTETLKSCTSVMKCWYFSNFSLCAV